MRSVSKIVVLALLLVALAMPFGAGTVLAQGMSRPATLVRFEGIVESRPEGKVGMWVIGGQSVVAVEETRLIEEHGAAEVGARVLVVARKLDDTLQAVEIAVRPPEVPMVSILGPISEIDVDYIVVNEQTINYDRSTRIVGAREVGVTVMVHAKVLPEGYLATLIMVRPEVQRRIVEFSGTIESIGETEWTVGGRAVKVSPRTVIRGEPEVGLEAKVRALRQNDGSLLALVIQVVPAPEVVEWTGVIERMPSSGQGAWLIGGRKVLVNRQTEIIGSPKVGDTAHVKAFRYHNRGLVATLIEVLAVTVEE